MPNTPFLEVAKHGAVPTTNADERCTNMKSMNKLLLSLVCCAMQLGCSQSNYKSHSEALAREIAFLFGIDSSQVVLWKINPRREGVAIYQLPLGCALVKSANLKTVENRPRCIEDIEYAYKILGASFPVKGNIVEIQCASNKYLTFENSDSRIVVAFSDQ